MTGQSAAQRADAIFDLDLARLFAGEGALDAIALIEAADKIHAHDVIAAGLELDGGAGLELDAVRERAHLHHAAAHAHLVQLDARRALHGGRAEPILTLA